VRWLPRWPGWRSSTTSSSAPGVFGPEYARCCPARVVFSHLRPGGGYRRLFESVAAGALVVQEAGDPACRSCCLMAAGASTSVPQSSRPWPAAYLENEGERRRVVEAGREAIRRCTSPVLWEEALQRLNGRWAEVLAVIG
jgi:hypothetical protein